MIIPDLNILLYAHNYSAPQHQEAREWWEGALSGDRPVGLAMITILGFLRLITNRVATPNAMPVKTAAGTIRGWLAMDCVRLVFPGDGHVATMLELIEHVGVAGNLTTDAHLAALAIEWKAEIASTDVDFARFPRLRWFNPLKKP